MRAKLTVREKPFERFCYLVESTEPGLDRDVDLTANKGLGRCTCEDFLYRVHPNQKKVVEKHDEPWSIDYCPHREKQPEGVTECIHIYGARRSFHRKHTMPFWEAFHAHDLVAPEKMKDATKRLWRAVKRLIGWKGEL